MSDLLQARAGRAAQAAAGGQAGAVERVLCP